MVDIYHAQAKPFMESGEIAKLADPKLDGKFDVEQLQRVVLTASNCVRQSSVWRPTMSEVNSEYNKFLRARIEAVLYI